MGVLRSAAPQGIAICKESGASSYPRRLPGGSKEDLYRAQGPVGGGKGAQSPLHWLNRQPGGSKALKQSKGALHSRGLRSQVEADGVAPYLARAGIRAQRQTGVPSQPCLHSTPGRVHLAPSCPRAARPAKKRRRRQAKAHRGTSLTAPNYHYHNPAWLRIPGSRALRGRGP